MKTPVCLRLLYFVFATGLAFGTAGCAPKVLDVGVPPYGTSSGGSGGSSVTCTGTCYVDPTGSDTTGDGSSGNPFQTITFALSIASAGATVQVNPGTYQAPSETFPLQVPANVILEGDVPNSGQGSTPTEITGTALIVPSVIDAANGTPAEATVVLGSGSTIEGFYIVGVSPTPGDSGELIAIIYPVANVNVLSNFLQGANASGILEQSTGSNTINSTVILAAGFADFTSFCTASGTPICLGGVSTGDVFQQDAFATSTSYGVVIENSGGGGVFDLGGGGVSAGANTICNNGGAGVYVNISPAATIWLQGEGWNNATPTQNNAVSGGPWDIVDQNNVSTINAGSPLSAGCPY